jgi:hypothetical protein
MWYNGNNKTRVLDALRVSPCPKGKVCPKPPMKGGEDFMDNIYFMVMMICAASELILHIAEYIERKKDKGSKKEPD